MFVDQKCSFCGSPDEIQRATAFSVSVACPRCGYYQFSILIENAVKARPITNVGAVSGWIRRQTSMGIWPFIENIDDWMHLRTLNKPTFRERVEQYLLAVAERSLRLDQPFDPVALDLVGISYSEDANDLPFCSIWMERGHQITC